MNASSQVLRLIGVSLCLCAALFHIRVGALDFGSDVLPIFSEKCFQCHGPDEKERKGDLRLDTSEGATKDLGGYAAVVPGKPNQSTLIQRIHHSDPDEIMPPPESELFLDPQEKKILNEWILSGAVYEQH